MNDVKILDGFFPEGFIVRPYYDSIYGHNFDIQAIFFDPNVEKIYNLNNILI